MGRASDILDSPVGLLMAPLSLCDRVMDWMSCSPDPVDPLLCYYCSEQSNTKQILGAGILNVICCIDY